MRTGAFLLLLVSSTAFAHEPINHEIVELSERIADAPARADLLLQRAWLWSLEHRFDEALADLALADALTPTSPEAVVLRARIYAAAGREPEAEAVLEALDPMTPSALALRASLREASGRLHDALDDYERAEARTSTIVTALGRGRVLRRLGRTADAIGAYREAIVSLRGAIVVRLQLIETLTDTGRFEEALREIALARGNARIDHRWALREAEVRAAMGQREQAARLRRSTADDLRRRIERRPTAARWVLLARALDALGDRSEAREAVNRALVLSPRFVEARRLHVELGGAR